MDTSVIIKISKNILKRYEPSAHDGIMFLYNVVTREIWMGNSSTRDLIKQIDGIKTLEQIYNNLYAKYENVEYSIIQQSYESIISDLLQKNFIEII